jgi:hypothetical protein
MCRIVIAMCRTYWSRTNTTSIYDTLITAHDTKAWAFCAASVQCMWVHRFSACT